ncbi:uncharacterized protein LOC118201367 [Stegodyphus dumicola]|uniref:uncharacterized protein LOC118201367 n=1 Tax=Stegodyphus dumicola TaxID=202533 RepID=UPI0015AAC137|nr:uncharacterized protein LOC118201367 [Stegodyphus dumicola]
MGLRSNLYSSYTRPSCVKTSRIARTARQFQGKNWGQSPHFQKLLYLTVAEKIALYAAPIWANPMGARKIRQLSALQRPFAINLCKAYRTTATNAAQVLAGIIPLHIKALMESAYAQLIHLRRDATFGNTTYSPVQYEHRGDVLRTHPSIKGTGIRTVKSNCLHRDTLTKIYTDGSKHEHGVGSAFIHYDGSNTEYTWKGHLKPENSVFQAEGSYCSHSSGTAYTQQQYTGSYHIHGQPFSNKCNRKSTPCIAEHH